MSRILLFVVFLFGVSNLFAGARFAPPTTPASNITFNLLEGNAFRINWTAGNGARRIVVVRQGAAVTATPVDGVDYNPNVVFGSGDAIQPSQFVLYDGSGASVDISGLQPATTYHVAIFEYNGSASTTEYLTAAFPTASQASLAAPSVQASNILAGTITGNSTTISWTNGNGQRRLVIARQGSPVNVNPVDLATYSNNSLFGSGTQIGTGNYSVYGSTGNSVTVTGLQPSTTYHYSVFEYNGSNGPVYLVPGATFSVSTAARPSVAASAGFFNLVEGATMRINWTNGNGSRRIVIARANNPVTAVPVDGVDYTASNTFGSGDAIQPGEFVVYDNTSTNVDVNGLQPNTTYHFRVFEYDGSGTSTAYLTSSFLAASQSTQTTPTMQASGLNFTNVSGSSVTLNWTNGDGARRIVVARQGAAVNADPVNLTSYSANSAFGSGTAIGGTNFVVFLGTGNSVTVTNLQINTPYHFAVYEANGNGTPVFLIPGATASITTPASPTVPASGVFFNLLEGGAFRVNWLNGNGQRRIVIARAGSPVTAVPVDGVDYNASPTFGSGDAVQPGEFVVYDNTSTSVDLSGLQAATTYHFRIYEYNGTGTNTAYLTSSFASGSQSTLSAPTTQVSAVNFTNIGGSTVRVNWTNGNGSGRIVIARQGTPVTADPVNLTSYTGSTLFGSGAQIGTGNFVVFRSTSPNNVTLTNLVPNTTYHFSVYEYNGNNTPVYLLPGVTANVTTTPQPTVPASAMFFNLLEGNTMRVNWTIGNGARRIVIAREGSPVTALPVNGIDYTASSAFGSGNAVQPGQFVVFDGVNGQLDLTGLQPNTIYHFAVFEYDGTGTATAYLTSSFLSGSQSTISAPTIQASSLIFSSLAANSMTVGWTNGNGAQRMVVARQGSPVNADPVNLTSYNPSAGFGTGSQIGTGNFVVYRNSGSNVNVTGLISGTTYHFAVYEFNGGGGSVYLVPGATGQATTLGPPQTQATAAMAGTITSNTMQLNWTNGSGNRRLVLMKATTAVDASPVNNGVYTANSFFGSGTQLGTGNYVVYDGTGSSILVTGLASSTFYHFAVFEFNSFGATSQFLLASPAIGNAATAAGLPVTFIDFTASRNNDGVQLQWSTAQEQNSAHFEVQRSADGQNYSTIGMIGAAGESTTRRDYLFTDRSPLTGVNYYRLRQVDKDNHYMYSKVISIRYDQAQLLRKIINPVQGTLLIDLAFNRTNSRGEWKLYDLQGRMVIKGIITDVVTYADISVLPAGMYILEAAVGDRRERTKIIKQ